jgi:hypothetical protein
MALMPSEAMQPFYAADQSLCRNSGVPRPAGKIALL